MTNQLSFEVQNDNGEVIGVVSDIVLDLEALEIAYVVIELNADGRLVAVPLSEVQIQAAGMAASDDMDDDEDEDEDADDSQDGSMAVDHIFVVTADGQMLADAPDFDTSAVPQLGDEAADWDADLQAYWSGEAAAEGDADETATPTAEATEADDDGEEAMTGELVGVALASDLIGLTVNGTDGNAMSSIADAILNHESGAIEYFVLTASAEANAEATLTPVPPSAFGWDGEADVLVLTVEQNVFAAAPSLPSGQYPDLTQDGWDSGFADYWRGY